MSFPKAPFQSNIQSAANVITTVWQVWLDQVQERLNSSSLSGPTTGRPTQGLYVGQTYFDTDINKPVYWNGTTWITW